MFEIRFHGRGGQGVKLASRIIGRAGFLAGLFAQDFPLFGAERQGAPVVATTRLSHERIEIRGFAEEPDLVVVLDPTLLKEARAQVLAGVGPATPVLGNTHAGDGLVASDHLLFVFIPATMIARRIIGEPAVSAVIAGAAARFVPEISMELLARAIDIELNDIKLSSDRIAKNIAAAQVAYTHLPSFFLADRGLARQTTRSILDLNELPVSISGFAATQIREVGNARLRHTGIWRSERPVIDARKCKRCFLCYLYCPDGAIFLDEQYLPHVDYDYCKGCLICYQECPTQAISFRLEEQEHGA